MQVLSFEWVYFKYWHWLWWLYYLFDKILYTLINLTRRMKYKDESTSFHHLPSSSLHLSSLLLSLQTLIIIYQGQQEQPVWNVQTCSLNPSSNSHSGSEPPSLWWSQSAGHWRRWKSCQWWKVSASPRKKKHTAQKTWMNFKFQNQSLGVHWNTENISSNKWNTCLWLLLAILCRFIDN